jgi:hypothetical protein
LADEPPVLDETAVALPRHADLERFAFLADAPEQDRRGFRLAWWTAVAAAVTVGAAAPVLIALLAARYATGRVALRPV